MEKEHKSSQTEIYIREVTTKVSHMVLGSIFGTAVLFIRVISKMGIETGMGFGKRVREIVINLKENIEKIRKMVMVFLLGIMGIFIKEIIRMMFAKATEKCIGLMVVTIKDSGLRDSNMGRVPCLLFRNNLHTIVRSKKGKI